MLQLIDGQKVHVCVVSAGRPENVKAMTEMVGAATWYVPPHQRGEYSQAGAVTIGEGSDQAVVPVRNRCIDDAEGQDAICVQLDDDLRWAAFASNGKAERLDSPRRAIAALIRRLGDSDFYLGGASPTNNAYFTRKQNSTNLFIRSGVMAIKPNSGLRFDEKLKVKFDYDLTIQHYVKFGGVLRCDDLIFEFQQRSSKGGHAQDRVDGRDEEACRYLLAKWPGLVKRHPRRQGEVLLSLPRHKREVMA
jgi:hypothetical protein